jgi:hypothetical protein
MYLYHSESTVEVQAPMTAVFALLDAHEKLSSHMSQSSWKMGGGKMKLEMDAGLGKIIGSRLRLSGRVFGLFLAVEGVRNKWRMKWLNNCPTARSGRAERRIVVWRASPLKSAVCCRR